MLLRGTYTHEKWGTMARILAIGDHAVLYQYIGIVGG